MQQISFDPELNAQLHRLACVFPNTLADLAVRIHKTPKNNLVLAFEAETDAPTIGPLRKVTGHGWTAADSVNQLMKRLKITGVEQYIRAKAHDQVQRGES